MAFLTDTKSGLDTNVVDSVTSSLDLTSHKLFTWAVVDDTGAHDNHEVILQISLDNVNFMDWHSKLGGIDVHQTERRFPVGYVRWKVAKAEGAISTVDIIINAK